MISCPCGYGVFRADLGLLICRPEGDLTRDRVLEITGCHGCLAGGEPLRFSRFHDLTGIRSIDLRFDDILLAARAEARARQGLLPVKACYLVADLITFGTMRMYQAIAEEAAVEVHVGYDVDALAAVLGVPRAELRKGA